MPKKKLYWLLQISGWTFWVINDLISYAVLTGFSWSLVEDEIINLFIFIGLTHYYRELIKKWNWAELPFVQLLPRMALCIFVMSFCMAILNIQLEQLLAFSFIDFDNKLLIITYIINISKPLTMWSLVYYSYHYFERKSEVEVEKIRLESSIRETEAKVLRAQMNPHFMFNALNSIRALVLEEPDKAQKAVTQLSNILRSSLLADRRKTVQLGEELRTVDDYLALEKIRYEDRLQIRKNIYPDTLGVSVPPMLIQTLVENGIKHGVSKPVKGGFVAIESQIKGEAVEIRISNTGILEKTDSEGIGIENTSHRLELLFGAKASFRIYQASKDVVCAEVTIPIAPDLQKVSTFNKITNIVRPRTRI